MGRLGKLGSPVGSRRPRPKPEHPQTARERLYRDRIRRGVAVIKGAEISGLGIDFLVAMGYLREADASHPNPKVVAKAVGAQ